ncbi:hypothetical protein BW261_12960 [Klebsiella aerogenes]|uniref:hypothetical protein n=1 Tax=Klebsiella aerogenes TaxID=548 RepID=UPI000980AC1C|nr:hypothetical protein [Klebsiella aerogenes]OQR44816.1 hypothetical protein BW261_12960 [Klebsiella aerogenes]
MTSKLTREERIQSLYDLKIGQVLSQSDIESIKMLARMALSAMDSEPVAIVEPSDYITAAQLVGEGPARKAVHELYEGALRIGDKLYRHAQQPVVPPEQHWEELCREHPDMSIGDAIIRAAWWNHCCAAMLNHPSSIQPNTGAAPGAEIKHPSTNSPVIPEGYVMVPKEPTAEMQSAGASAIRIETTALNKLWTGNAVFRAMLAAAPQEVK